MDRVTIHGLLSLINLITSLVELNAEHISAKETGIGSRTGEVGAGEDESGPRGDDNLAKICKVSRTNQPIIFDKQPTYF